jgi:hypothetical protein
MSSTPAVYPTSLVTFTTKVNHIDVYNDDHINKLQNEVIAMQTYVGTSPQGGFSDFASRVNRFLNGTGVIVNSNAFPADTTPMRLFYRTDSETMFIRKSDNSAWQSIGGSPSNVIFSWTGMDSSTQNANTGFGIFAGTNASATGILAGNLYYLTGQTVGTYTLIRTKISKISGISTLKIYTRMYTSGASGACSAILDINAGAVTGTTTKVTGVTPTWLNSANIDVSGLSNGTVYDMLVKISTDADGSSPAYMSSVIIFGA